MVKIAESGVRGPHDVIEYAKAGAHVVLVSRDQDRLGGDGFGRLHEWFVAPDGTFGQPDGPAGQLVDEMNAAGAAASRCCPASGPSTSPVS